MCSGALLPPRRFVEPWVWLWRWSFSVGLVSLGGVAPLFRCAVPFPYV